LVMSRSPDNRPNLGQNNHTNERDSTTFLPKTLGNRFMDHFTYKMFNLHFSIRYETYNSHLHTTQRKCMNINLCMNSDHTLL